MLLDLYIAYANARKHKANKPYVKEFERNLHGNLERLADELVNMTYKAMPSMCFIITDPKKREVFAAMFVDRIVHHLYYMWTHEVFERCFIHDSYSCIKNRGTHFGIGRLEHHIRSESRNYTRKCYVLKLDICGYFMHIDRRLLMEYAMDILGRKYTDEDTREIVMYLTREITLLNPMEGCHVIGDRSRWNDLPRNKSLRYSDEGCGLPIGNLTSQLFSNVYLDRLDQYCKRVLKCRHYGRYVDDAYIVSCDRDMLREAIPKIQSFLRDTLRLELHMGKTQIHDVNNGVEYLGAYLKPNRRYISSQSLRRMRVKIAHDVKKDKVHTINSMLSRFGVLSHYASHNIKIQILNSL